MRSILVLGVVLIFTVAIVGGMLSKDIINCSSVSENLNISEVIPIRYDVRIEVKPHLRMLIGYANILFDIKKPTRNIKLHAVSSRGYEADAQPGDEPYKLFEFQYCEKKEVLILKFNKILSEGQYRLMLVYRSVSNKNIQNVFYPTTWTTKNEALLLTNLYTPNSIRAFFPCWDDPRVIATYNISIQIPVGFSVLSTIPEKSYSYIRIPQVPFTVVTVYQEFVSKPTHLIAFLVVSDIMLEYEQRNIHCIWHQIDTDEKFTYVLERAVMATVFFTKLMKIKSLALPRNISHVVLPNSPMKSMGAPGLVIYREKDIIFNKDLDFPGRFIDISMLVTYEMARQLFVGVVPWETNLDYVWLNEIFASFFGYYTINEIPTADRLMELFVVKIIQPALDSDTFLERKPIIQKTKNSKGIDALLYPLLYHKKALALIRMLSKLYHPEYFKYAFRRYIHERTKDVWTILEEVHSLKTESGYTVKEIMNTWLTVKHHPELFIQRDYETWSFACASPFVDSKWIIPINFITESNYESYNISEVLWFKLGQMKSIYPVHKDDFLIVNIEQTGYYRVNYDTKNWLLISTYLQKHNISHIPPVNRAQLVNDAYYFTTKNQLATYIFVNITKHLQWDTDFVAWYPMFNILSDMSSYLKFSESNRIKAHFLKILDVVTRIAYEDSPWDDTMKKSLRYLLRKWACKLGHSGCRNAAFYRLTYHLDHQDKIPEMSKEWIFCDGVKVEDLNAWGSILKESMNYKNVELLDYLSCTENTMIIVHYLTLMLQSDYFSEVEEFMGPICRNIVKKHVRKTNVLRFVIENYDAIQTRFPQDFPPGVLLSDIIMNVYSWEDLDMIQEYVDKSPWIMHFGSKSFEVLIRQWKIYLMKMLNKFQMFHA